MAETWVINASPLIVLAKAGRLALINDLCEAALLPTAVFKEVMAGPASDPARMAVAAGFGRRISPSRLPSRLVEWGLGAGETEVLAIALEHPPCVALLDDAAARAAARTMGVPTLGTLGVIVRAKLRGLIPSAEQALAEVRQAGLYLDHATIAAALHAIGERWEG